MMGEKDNRFLPYVAISGRLVGLSSDYFLRDISSDVRRSPENTYFHTQPSLLFTHVCMPLT